MDLRVIRGNVLNGPDGTIIVHATNCLGSWGAGVAKSIGKAYPFANEVYLEHCTQHKADPTALAGTCLLIPPQAGDHTKPKSGANKASKSKPKLWIACLNTSVGYGSRPNPRNGNRKKDDPATIVRQTRAALQDFKTQLEALRNGDMSGLATDGSLAIDPTSRHSMPTAIWSVRFNSGLFSVSWDRTEAVIKEVFGRLVEEEKPVEDEEEGEDAKGKGPAKARQDDKLAWQGWTVVDFADDPKPGPTRTSNLGSNKPTQGRNGTVVSALARAQAKIDGPATKKPRQE